MLPSTVMAKPGTRSGILASLVLALWWGYAPSAPGQILKDGPHIAFPMGGDTQDPETAFGWHVMYEYTDLMSADLALTRMVDSLDGHALGVGPFPAAGSAEVENWVVAISARVGTLVGHRTYIYLSGGAGYYFFNEQDMQEVRRSLDAAPVAGPSGGRITDARLSVDDTFGYHLGAGVEWLLVPKWEIFADYRLAYLDTDSSLTVVETIPSSGPGPGSRTHERSGRFDYDHGLLRVGINYRF